MKLKIHLVNYLLSDKKNKEEYKLIFFIFSDAPSRPSNPVIKDFDSDFVELGWDKPKADGGSPITGYIIEKKDKFRYLYTYYFHKKKINSCSHYTNLNFS